MWEGGGLVSVTHLDIPREIHTACTSTTPTQSEKRSALINTKQTIAEMLQNNLVLFSGEIDVCDDIVLTFVICII